MIKNDNMTFCLAPLQVIECENKPDILVVSQILSHSSAAGIFQDPTFLHVLSTKIWKHYSLSLKNLRLLLTTLEWSWFQSLTLKAFKFPISPFAHRCPHPTHTHLYTWEITLQTKYPSISHWHFRVFVLFSSFLQSKAYLSCKIQLKYFLLNETAHSISLEFIASSPVSQGIYSQGSIFTHNITHSIVRLGVVSAPMWTVWDPGGSWSLVHVCGASNQ